MPRNLAYPFRVPVVFADSNDPAGQGSLHMFNPEPPQDMGDPLFSIWRLAWVAHQIVRDPLHLFDANIFHPEPNTLAYSEHMIVQAVMGAPLVWAGLPSLLVHNVLVMAGLALTGWTMWLVMYRWTGDPWASTLAGLLLAFNAHSLTRLVNLQAMHVECLPLAVYALDRVLARPRTATAVALGVAIALQSLTSNYLLVMMAFAMTAAVAVRPGDWIGRGRGRTFAHLALAAAFATVLLVPFLLPYSKYNTLGSTEASPFCSINV